MIKGLYAFISALAISWFAVPAIINLAKIKKLYDEPNGRKVHTTRIPTLGGIAIFGGFILPFVFFSEGLSFPQFNSTLSALIILFVIGIKDDLFPLTASKKMLGQLASVLIVVFQGDIRIANFYGLFGIHDLSYWFSVGFTVFVLLLITNAFNLIDGINGLSAGIGIIVLSTYAYWFYQMDDQLFFILCLAYVGALFGFMRYNFVKAKIFMGDSGSLLLGFIIAVVTVHFIQKAQYHQPYVFFSISGSIYAFNLLIIPLFDTLRVFTIRILNKRSPFSADRNHIHHRLIDLGMSHIQAASLLFTVNFLFIGMASLLDVIRPRNYLVLMILVAWILSQLPILIKRYQNKSLQ